MICDMNFPDISYCIMSNKQLRHDHMIRPSLFQRKRLNNLLMSPQKLKKNKKRGNFYRYKPVIEVTYKRKTKHFKDIVRKL